MIEQIKQGGSTTGKTPSKVSCKTDVVEEGRDELGLGKCGRQPAERKGGAAARSRLLSGMASASIFAGVTTVVPRVETLEDGRNSHVM